MNRMIAVTAMLTFAGNALAGSGMVIPAAGYVADDLLTGIQPSGFDVFSGGVAAWDVLTGTLGVYEKSGAVVAALGGPAEYLAGHSGNVWNSFVRADPSGASVWAGFTTGGNLDDRIYQVDLAGGGWTWRATLAGNFDLAFRGQEPFVSGLNSANWADPNCLWLLDASGQDQHRLIATIGGWSAGLAFDAGGSLYALAAGVNRLVRFSSEQVDGAVGGTSLSLSDAVKLADLEYSPYDVDVDAGGRVVFTLNGAASQVCLWNGVSGDGGNYGVIGTGAATNGWDWFTFLAGDGTSVYLADAAVTGLAEIVPEPATIGLLAVCGAALVRARRRLH